MSEGIKKANKIQNPLSLISSSGENLIHCYLKKLNDEVTIECFKSKKLNKLQREWAFNLFLENMLDIYMKSQSGWNETEKRDEMFNLDSYYLIAYKKDEEDGKAESADSTSTCTRTPVGYCHFQFDMDYESEVVYCYELQVEREVKQAGLGTHMMTCLERLCKCYKFEKVILTCSKHNPRGLSFYKEKLNYERDETDLNDEDPTVDYEILSKDFCCDEEEEQSEGNVDEEDCQQVSSSS